MEAHITITGHVQGVFFRANGREKAQTLGLTGWIKNEANGTVSVCVQGPREAIETFLAWCKQGPSSADVQDVEVQWNENPHETFDDFEIRAS